MNGSAMRLAFHIHVKRHSKAIQLMHSRLETMCGMCTDTCSVSMYQI